MAITFGIDYESNNVEFPMINILGDLDVYHAKSNGISFAIGGSFLMHLELIN